MKARNRRAQAAFTFRDLLVIMVIAPLLATAMLGCFRRQTGTSSRMRCASNLKQIGQAMLLYANENHGAWPRTIYDRNAALTVFNPGADDGTTQADPFGATPIVANDVTAAIWLLVRTQDIGTEVFTCPFSKDERDFRQPVTSYSNFMDPKNLSYSFAVMYPTQTAVDLGYKWTSSTSAEFAVAADKNPRGNAVGITSQSPIREQRKLNSRNHDQDGQNVLYCDGHVDWSSTSFYGSGLDCIYARAKVTPGQGKTPPMQLNPAENSANGSADPATTEDSILLPAEGGAVSW